MIIDSEKAKPGMRLQEDVCLPSGAILVNGSQVLTAQLIKTIVQRGIQKIQVVPDEKEAIVVADEQQPADEPDALPTTASQHSESPPSGPSLPKLKVFVSKDAMSAKLCVEPSGPDDGPLLHESIIEALHAEGVIFGIDEKAVLGVIDKWTKFKRYYEVDGIAQGSAPQAAKDGDFECTVKFVADPAQLATAKKAQSFRDFAESGIECQRVDAGMTIAKKHANQPAIPGTTVKGGSVLTDEKISSPVNFDATVEFEPTASTILAKATGVVFFVNNTIGVCPVNFDAAIKLSISPDKMKADALFHPPGERGKPPVRAQLDSLIWNAKIVYGVLDGEIDKILADCARGHYPAEPITVVAGKPARNGDNGDVEFLFNRETSLKPKVNLNGSVDYKNVELVVSVKKDQEIARLTPPGKGTPGKNIFGQEIKCVDGTPAKLPMGPNTGPSPTDSTVLVAMTDGIIKYNGSIVEISEGFFIKGNVDFSSGNINYVKSVIVGGDVTSGFKVQCGGDLQVAGTIEDAEIIVGGNVLCKLGFVGQGKGIIDAKGDVNLTFTKNQTVKTRQNVNIAKESLNCNVYARKTISVHGNPISIVGGKMVARDSITAYTVGNISGVKTVLEVGVDFSLLEELEKTDGQLTEINDNKRKLMLTFTKMHHEAEKSKPGGREEILLNKLKNAIMKLDQQIKILEERKKIVVANMYEFNNAHIKIEHAALPGTVFKIGSRLFQVKTEIVGPKTVRLVDEEIRVF
jgi:uncharacterized protein